MGIIPASGYVLDKAYSKHDARKLFPSYAEDARKRAGEMPPGCDCAQVVLGRIYPNECRLFGVACKPRNPIGPCMVSDEGACRIWWSGGMREPATAKEQKAVVSSPACWMEKTVDIYSRRGAVNAEVSIICRSDFSRELSKFATKVAPTITCKPLCVLCASAR